MRFEDWTHLRDVRPLLFPCNECRQLQFHAVFRENYGLYFRLPLTRRILFSSHCYFHIVCLACLDKNIATNNGRLSKSDVRLMKANYIPKAIWKAFPIIKPYYTPGGIAGDALADWIRECGAEVVDGILDRCKQYRLET